MTYLKLIETNFFGRPWVHAAVSEQLIIMLPKTKDGRYVTISQSRPTFKERVLSPIMGTFHETDCLKLLETAAKEIKSETGHVAINVEYMMTIARSPGLTDETAHIYSALVEDEAGEQELHPEEDIEVIYFNSWSEIFEALDDKEIIIDGAMPYYLIR